MDEFLEKCEKLSNSISKNKTEFVEFIVDNFDITNYYDLVEKIAELKEKEKGN